MSRARDTELPAVTERDQDRERSFPAVFVMVADDNRPTPESDHWTGADGSRHALSRSTRLVLILRYGRNGGCTAYNYYTGQRIGRATGGNYDITSTALADAASRWYGVPRTDGARGRSWVRAHLNEHGVTLYDMGQAAHALPVGEVTR